MKVTALLPMKGNSERVKNKNMRDFAGKPLYHAVMNVLLQCRNIDKVVINTDSEIIKNDALKNFDRVQIIDRPVEIQGDFVAMNDIIAYDLSKLEGEHFLQTHSTNPLVKPETIDRAIDEYFANLGKYDSVFSVTRLQTRLYWTDGKPVNHNPAELLRTQDLPPVYEENSNFFVFSKTSFAAAGNKRIGIKPAMSEMNKLEAVDIDEPEDFELAELLYIKRKNG
ncbi:cytidylyltransferase domain-containing protein [Seleniivibrio woodruffii]|uniref:acylneuraminate cytidylyltransferase family protein n=1 Tax=Seleniivibrio woodruffii TaxID=1078050 RepID=UPI0026EF464F|nr:acylneuraminate cytidylyltransferase family protein [Seleniivibrio woodruffii]